ncbi:conserved membrane protein of unknown function [Georgfuchsia toluolica]|uniref:Uncharacterized protein n=2 Tax=Georgfuchsia toluolica TaxID=424218 RepID=A0A916N2E5_9PROT|nr:conserved membrane protein of unknown function [Georgfuchsia toluolica]
MLLAAGMALWLLNHPYAGIWHDARIYTLLAVHWLNPIPFAADPWFHGGSADELSLFAPVYGTLIKWLGISAAAKLMTLVGGFAWAVATWLLSLTCFERRPAAFIFFALVSVPLTYCLGKPVFVLAESFVTARLFAIPLSIAGLVAAIGGRFRTGLVLQLLGMLFHPLMSVWGLLAVICLKLSDRVVVALAALTLGIVAVMFMNPADIAFLRIMDPEWQAAVKASAMVVFLDPWPKIAINDALWWFSVLLFAGHFGLLKLRRLYQVVCLISVLALLVSLITSYFLPVVFFLQAQFWRALWLAVLLGFVAAMDVGWLALKTGGSVGKGIAGLLVVTFLFRDWGGGLVLFLAFCVWSIKSRQILMLVENRTSVVARVAWMLVIGALACVLPDLLMDIWILFELPKASAQGLIENMVLMVSATFFYTVIPLLLWSCLTALKTGQRYAGIFAASVSGLFFLVGIGLWDQRSDLKRYEESRYHRGGNRDMFPGLIQPGKQVYWNGHVLRVWFDLGTSSYVSSEQAIGIVFSEVRMKEVKRRLERVLLKSREPLAEHPMLPDGVLLDARLSEIASWNRSPLNLHAYEKTELVTRAGLRSLCRDPQLDFVIDTMNLGGWSISEYTEMVRNKKITYYLYDCRKLPKGMGS